MSGFTAQLVGASHWYREVMGSNPVEVLNRERFNACIGDISVGGGTLQWKFHDALDGLSQDEIELLALDDIKKCKDLSVEQSAWTIAKNVAKRINHEPGPAEDYSQSFLTPHKNAQFLFNSKQLHWFVSAPQSKQKNITEAAYFKKLNKLMTEHFQVGELYLEYLKGDCQKTNKTLCEFCTKPPCLAPGSERVARPMPPPLTRPLPLLQLVPK